MWQVTFLLAAIISGSLANNRSFPIGFKWGASTSAYQIEGGWNADGKGPSAVDIFTGVFPNLFHNDTGAIACDSYHKWREDIALLKELGVKTYRMSISWPRILPTGNANLINQAGVDYYLNIFKALKENGIEPYVTLLHFDTPAVTVFVNILTVGTFEPTEFANYARVCFKLFGDHVKYWFTVNEPQSLALSGVTFLKGSNIYHLAKNILMAHALAWRVYDDEFRAIQKGNISAVLNSDWYVPVNSSNPDDINAAYQDLQFMLGWFAEPIYFGNWPQVVIDRMEYQRKAEGLNVSRLPEFTQQESKIIKGTHDFFAINHYGSFMVQPLDPLAQNLTEYERDRGSKRSSNATWTCPKLVPGSSNYACAYPQGLRDLLNYINKTFSPHEILITENGWPNSGGVQDPDRVAYYDDYLGVLLETINEDHLPVTTYQTWSLMDNFEWTFGYNVRFGIVSVDFNDENRTRTPKDSFKWYKKVVAANSLDIDFTSS